MKVSEVDGFKGVVLLVRVGKALVAGEIAGYTQREQSGRYR